MFSLLFDKNNNNLLIKIATFEKNIAPQSWLAIMYIDEIANEIRLAI